MRKISTSYGNTTAGYTQHEVVRYEHKGYQVIKEYGGYGVAGTLFNTLKAARLHIDELVRVNSFMRRLADEPQSPQDATQKMINDIDNLKY